MPITRLEVLERTPYEIGRVFGAAGAYERIDAIAHYAVDPANVANAGVVDLALAERRASAAGGDDGARTSASDLGCDQRTRSARCCCY